MGGYLSHNLKTKVDFAFRYFINKKGGVEQHTFLDIVCRSDKFPESNHFGL